MPAVLGMRGTGDFPADHRPENWREKFLQLMPNGSAPLTAILSMLASEPTDDPEYHNFTKALPDFKFTHSGTALAGATTLTATSSSDASFVRVGSMIRNWRTGEVAKVTALPSNTTFTVTRGVGNGGTGIAVNANDIWFLIGDASAEGATAPSVISWDATSTENYTQIFREPVQFTRTAIKTKTRTGDAYKEKLKDALTLHMMKIERSILFGKKDLITGSNGEPERYTGGIIPNLTSNVLDLSGASGIMSEATFDTFLAQYAFAFGSSEKLALMGWKAANLLNTIAKAKYQISSVDVGQSYGLHFTRYTTPFGDLLVKTHPQFRQLPGAESTMLILDTADLKYRYIDDTQLLKDRQANDMDGVMDEYLTECGLELLQEKTHALISGWLSLT